MFFVDLHALVWEGSALVFRPSVANTVCSIYACILRRPDRSDMAVVILPYVIASSPNRERMAGCSLTPVTLCQGLGSRRHPVVPGCVDPGSSRPERGHA